MTNWINKENLHLMSVMVDYTHQKADANTIWDPVNKTSCASTDFFTFLSRQICSVVGSLLACGCVQDRERESQDRA